MKHLLNKKIKIWDDHWLIIGVGVERDGAVYLHLSSLTRFEHCRNGMHPVQVCDFVPIDSLDIK